MFDDAANEVYWRGWRSLDVWLSSAVSDKAINRRSPTASKETADFKLARTNKRSGRLAECP